MDRRFHLGLRDYYVVEAFNAIACTIFGSCIYFWTRARYGFTDTENLLLGTAQGILYVIAPLAGGRLGDRFGYDRMLLIGTVGMLLTELLTILVPWRIMPFATLMLFTGSMSLTWPVLEASVVVYPGRLATPDRLGIYNIVWAAMAAVGFFAAGALFRWHPSAILWATLVVHIAQLVWILPRRATAPVVAVVRAAHRGDHVARNVKARFLRLAWVANCIGYLMQSGLVATAPAIGEHLGLRPSLTIWLVCTFYFARGAAFVALWRSTGWHYRFEWITAALLVGPASLAMAFFSASPAMVFGALIAFGAAVGMGYYASIYYSLDYGEEKGAHSGWHESIIGLGALMGPLTGVAGAAIFGTTAGAQGAIVLASAAVAASGLGWMRRARFQHPL